MSDDDEAIRQEIRRVASARSEAAVYSLQNSYLTDDQKSRIEAVYQFPLGVMHYAFAAFALGLGYQFGTAWLAASAVGAVSWLAARFLPGKLFWPIGLLCGGTLGTIIAIGLAVAAAVMGRYGVGAYLAAAAFGLTSLIELPMWLWSSSRRMNPKYHIAKRMFGMTFPFERDLV